MGAPWARHRGSGLRVTAVLAALVLVGAAAACGDDDGDSGGASGSGDSESSSGGNAATGAQFCDGMDITFFPGGTEGGGFETVVYNGAQAAEEAFGPNVTYQWSDWDPSTMVSQFQEAVASGPDGIAVMGHPGDDAFGPLIDDAVGEGIIVTAMNTELPAAQTAHATAGFGYVGAVLHDAGFNLAQEAIERGDLQSGDRVFVWGLQSQPGRGERTQGILDALDEAGMTVDYLEIDDATNADPANGVSAFTGYVSANPDVTAIFIDHGNLTSTIPTYLEAANLGPDDVYAAGFDLAPATVEGVQDGSVDLVIDQQQWLQGFEAILQLCLTHSYGFSGLKIDTGGGFVDAENIDLVAPLVEQQIR
jgi:simple sugar transport system substrate-binding protein